MSDDLRQAAETILREALYVSCKAERIWPTSARFFEGLAVLASELAKRELAPPQHMDIHPWSSPTAAVETCIEAVVRAGLLTVGGEIGDRINRRIEPEVPEGQAEGQPSGVPVVGGLRESGPVDG